MHRIAIPDEIVAAARAMRGGRARLFEDFDPARTAHVIIDMQNGYMEDGAPLEVPFARSVVPHINSISGAVRRAGGTNVFIQYGMYAEAERSWSTWHAEHNSAEGLAVTYASFAPGTHYWELWPGLDIAQGDLIVEKQRFSAFIPGTCALDEMLRARGIDTLIISGTMTNVCCESTARDAMQMIYKVIFVSDATATWTDAAHNGTLANMAMIFADVMSTQEVIGLLNAKLT